MLRTFPHFVLDDITEILYNILYKNVKIRNARHKSALKRKQRILTRIVSAHDKKTLRKKLILQQKGGFIGALLPILTSVLAATAL